MNRQAGSTPWALLRCLMAEVEWMRLELEIRNFMPVPLVTALAPDIRMMTLPELGDDERRRRQIYDLNKECAADIPERGEFFTWTQYQRVRFDVPQFRPDGQLLAVARDELVGLCQVSQRPGVGWAFVEMTAVRRGWRGYGIAIRLKLAAIEAARGWGCTQLRTVNHPNNGAIIAVNRKLGFHDADFNLRLE